MLVFRTLLLGLLLAASASAETITVGAAISLRDAMGEIAKAYEADTGDRVELHFGSSGQLMAQVKSGAPLDVFISAGVSQVDELGKLGLVDDDTRRNIAGNTMVLIAPADAKSFPSSFKDLADPRYRRIAIGDPRTVPAGEYAMQVLKALKLAAALSDRLVYGANVRQVLDYVERGEVAAGVVYATDARESGAKVRVIATADPSLHEPVQYPGVVVKASRKQAAARRFLDYLAGHKARSILAAHGFLTQSPPPTTAPSR